MDHPDAITRLNAALEGCYRIEREIGEGGMGTAPDPQGGVLMDRFPVPMPRPLRLAAALLIASVAIGCQGDNPAAPAEDGSDQNENEAATIRAAEREALVALYNSTDGGNWTNNTGRLLSDDPCGWFGVTCLSGRGVTEVSLDSNNLTGSIPAELGT